MKQRGKPWRRLGADSWYADECLLSELDAAIGFNYLGVRYLDGWVVVKRWSR